MTCAIVRRIIVFKRIHGLTSPTRCKGYIRCKVVDMSSVEAVVLNLRETVCAFSTDGGDLSARIYITWHTVTHESDLQKNHGDWKPKLVDSLPFHRSISYLYPSLHTTAHSARPNTSHPTHNTLHGTRLLNICSSCSATNHVFWLSVAMVFLKVIFVCNGVSSNVNPCAQVPAVSRKCAHSFHTCLIYFFDQRSAKTVTAVTAKSIDRQERNLNEPFSSSWAIVNCF